MTQLDQLSGHPYLVLAGLGVLIAYVASCYLHPYRKCPACKGSGRHVASIWTVVILLLSFGLIRAYADRECSRCGGNSGARRLGSWMLGRGKPTRGASRIPPSTRQYRQFGGRR